MNILILTDHGTHSSSNSFYLIANSLFKHSDINSVYLASRTLPSNSSFFKGKSINLHAKCMDSETSYDTFDQWINTDSKAFQSLEEFDIILLRLPRPIPLDFFPLLQNNFDEKRIVNRPSGILKTGNKQFLLNVSIYCPPIALVKTIEEIEEFKSNFPIVLKPLEDYGGKGIIKIEGSNAYLGNERNISFDEFKVAYGVNPQPYLAMKFLKNVKNGDKRIVVANGQILTSSVRFPAEGSWLCNVAQGGSAILSLPTTEEKEIIEYIDPIMAREGVFMYGLDTLENDEGQRIISEINTLSVGGIAPAAEMSGNDLGHVYAELFVNFISKLN